MKIFIIPFIFFSIFLRAEVKVETSSYTIVAGTIKQISMVTFLNSGEVSSSTDPMIAYIPLNSGGGQEKNVNISPPDNDYIPSAVTPGASYITARVIVSNSTEDGQNRYLYAAAKDNDDYIIVSSPSIEVVNGTNQLLVDCQITIEELYSKADVEIKPGSISDSIEVIYFVGTTSAVGDKVDLTDLVPAYFKFYFSDKIPSGNIMISDMKKGDGRVTIVMSGGESVSEMTSSYGYKTLILKWPSLVQKVEGTTIFDFYNDGGALTKEENIIKSGELDIKDLKNLEEVNFSVALMNKFRFTSELSNSFSQTPEPIEAFLKKQACYLISAGFKRDHYVLDYLRRFRDTILAKTVIGRSFINFYYETAPKYAPYIYNSSVLSFLSRTAGYIAYYCLKYFPFVLGLLYIIFLRPLFKRKMRKRLNHAA